MRSDQTTLNNIAAAFLVLIIALAPIPVGSNRPAYWAIIAVFVGLLGAVYVISLLRIGAPFRVKLSNMRTESILFCVFIAYMIFTALPLGFATILPEVPNIDLINDPTGSLLSSISIAPGQTILAALKIATYGLVFLIGIQVAINPDRAHAIVVWIAIIGTVYALVGLGSLFMFEDTYLGLPKTAYLGSATGTFVNRNSFATFLGLGLCAAAALSVNKLTRPRAERDPSDRIDGLAFAVCTVIIMACILATQSRMGLFADSVGLVLVSVLATHPTESGRKYNLLGLGAIIAGVILIALFYGQGTMERLGSLEGATDVRLELYRQTLDLVSLRPLTGFGAGTFELAFPLVHTLPVSPDLYWDKAHNTYLTLFAECGIVFGILPILVIGLISWKTGRVRALSKNRQVSTAVALSTTAIVTLHSLADFSLEIHAVTLCYTLCLAVGAAGAYVPNRAHNVS